MGYNFMPCPTHPGFIFARGTNLTFNNSRIDYDLKKIISGNRLVGLWRLMTGFQLIYVLAVISLGIAAIAKSGTYFLLRYFVDTFFINQDQRFSPALIGLGFVGLALLQGGFTFISGKFAAQTAEGSVRRLRNYLYDHIQNLSFAYHAQTETGELIQRSTSDVDAIRRFYADQAIGFGRIVLLFVINFIALAYLNLKLALISIIVVPIIVVISMIFFKRISQAYEAYQEQDATLSTRLQENLTGVQVVKAFARQKYEIQKFEIENWEKFILGKKLLSMHSMFWPISDIFCGIQLLAGYLIGALMTINGELTIGTYLAYSGLVVWIIFPMRNLGRLIIQMSTGMVSYQRVVEIIKQDREPLDEGDTHPEHGVNGEIHFNQVCFEYDTGSEVLKDITFHCKPGQVIALLGSTGSGKTTLVNLLPRFYDYTSGNILLDGIELNRYPRRYLRQQIGIVEQEPFLFSRTIRENIHYGVNKEVTQEEIENAANIAAIHEVIRDFPDGYNTLVGERGATLSGGQKQRIAIARTLLKKPRILILDDSTSSVDTETEAEIRAAMEKLMQNRTTFIIAHRIQTIMNADLILVMEKGKIVQQGTHEELVHLPGMYREIFNIQTSIELELEKELSSDS